MRRFLAALTVACLGLAFIGTLPASATNTLNDQVSGAVGDWMDSITSPLCPPFTGGVSLMPYQPASGNPGTLKLGMCQLTYKSTTFDGGYARYTYEVAGAFEIDTPAGDVVRGDVAGIYMQLTHPGKSSYTWDLTLTLTSGSGQFEGAKGTIKLVASFFFGGRTDGHVGSVGGTLTGSVTPGTK